MKGSKHDYYQTTPMIKVPLLGEAAVGKTSIAKYLSGGVFREDYELTVGVDIFIRFLQYDGLTFKLLLWDIAGQRRFSPLRKIFYRGAKGALVVFDITRPETFKMIPSWINDLQKHEPNTPFVLVGNKLDLESRRVIDRDSGEKLARYYNTAYFETSAKTGEGVLEAVRYLIKRIALKRAAISF